MRIGIDSGGTFTDFVVFNDALDGVGKFHSFKLLSNPANPAAVILEGIRRIAARRAEVVHGSTVATNALLERKGAKTAFVTTRGFEDLLAIGRQNRPELYNLTPRLPIPLVPKDRCFGVEERILFEGTIEQPLQLDDIRARVAGAESIAICLLHSYRNDAHERALLKELAGLAYISASCDISPEFREFERAATTAVNAYVGPLMDSYLGMLERDSPHPVAIMQSNGGLLTAAEARRHAVRTVLSGPAGGIVAAVEIARLAGFKKALSFDMGGTSTDVALAGQTPRLTTETRIDNYPVRIPMLDIHTVGAGGGSIARVDAGGSLRVGPESAGAVPGPACYGSGDRPTVTDAHVVLGRIAPDQLLGGAMHIDPARAEAALTRLGVALGVNAKQAAAAVIRVANSNMERAIRAVSVERGEDPRDFPLVAFGGCGGLHACELATELGVKTVIVPAMAGALSALGMLLADKTRDYSVSVLGTKDHPAAFGKLEKLARKDQPQAGLERLADVRYAGQSYELTIPWESDFHKEHHRVYGYSDPARATETVTLRLRATVKVPKPRLTARRPVAIPKAGPALIRDYGSTTLVPRGWSIRQTASGSMILTAHSGK
ncbi:MAG: hydantoinase/oxoprolinase family protein [Terriglobia bacterium]